MDPSLDQISIENQGHLNSPVKPKVLESIRKWMSELLVVTKAELEEAGVFIGNIQNLKDRP